MKRVGTRFRAQQCRYLKERVFVPATDRREGTDVRVAGCHVHSAGSIFEAEWLCEWDGIQDTCASLSVLWSTWFPWTDPSHSSKVNVRDARNARDVQQQSPTGLPREDPRTDDARTCGLSSVLGLIEVMDRVTSDHLDDEEQKERDTRRLQSLWEVYFRRLIENKDEGLCQAASNWDHAEVWKALPDTWKPDVTDMMFVFSHRVFPWSSWTLFMDVLQQQDRHATGSLGRMWKERLLSSSLIVNMMRSPCHRVRCAKQLVEWLPFHKEDKGQLFSETVKVEGEDPSWSDDTDDESAIHLACITQTFRQTRAVQRANYVLYNQPLPIRKPQQM